MIHSQFAHTQSKTLTAVLTKMSAATTSSNDEGPMAWAVTVTWCSLCMVLKYCVPSAHMTHYIATAVDTVMLAV
jgi:hypothetical protein